MKQTLRLRGKLCPKCKPLINLLYTVFIIFTIVLVSCVCSKAQVPTSSPEAGPAAGAVDELKPLEIGDTIPDALWNLPLQVVNHPKGKKTITLDDYRGKLIILDFWATWCGSCIKTMPEMERLEKRFKDDIAFIPISDEEEGKIAEFLLHNERVRDLNLFSVGSDTVLKKVFPHRLIPHSVIINQHNIVESITTPTSITEEVVGKQLSGAKINVPVKRDIMDFDISNPLIQTALDADEQNLMFSSVFTHYINGIAAMSGSKKMGNRIKYYFTNRPSIEIYEFASQKRFHHIRAVNVDSPAIFLKKLQTQGESWDHKNLFCYELIVPASFSFEQVQELIVRDMNRYLNVEVKVIAGTEQPDGKTETTLFVYGKK